MALRRGVGRGRCRRGAGGRLLMALTAARMSELAPVVWFHHPPSRALFKRSCGRHSPPHTHHPRVSTARLLLSVAMGLLPALSPSNLDDGHESTTLAVLPVQSPDHFSILFKCTLQTSSSSFLFTSLFLPSVGVRVVFRVQVGLGNGFTFTERSFSFFFFKGAGGVGGLHCSYCQCMPFFFHRFRSCALDPRVLGVCGVMCCVFAG